MRLTRYALVGAALLGCGGGGGGGTPPNPVPASVAIAVSGGTGNMTAAGQTRTLTATVRDASQQVISGAQVAWVSSAPTIVTVSPATGASTTATAVANGTSTITATAGNADGDVDLTVAIGGGGPFPNTAEVTATTGNEFTPASVDIAQGGSVTWTFQSVVHNVTFSAATGAPSNIGDTSNSSASRTFNSGGSFGYRCTIHSGMNGTVVVH